MSQQPPRRGLGRGLGSLIPTAPPQEATETPAQSGSGSTSVSTMPRPAPDQPPAPAGRHLGAPSEPTESGGSSSTPGSAATPSSEPGTSSDQPSSPMGAYFAELPVAEITPNPRQPRQVFEEEAMAELVHSVKEIGLLQPVVVRRTGPHAYELIMGERRWRAMKQAGIDTIPAIVRETDDDAMLRDALLENLHRSQLNPLEEAAAYQQMLDDFGCTHDELANRIGRSRPQISNTLRLLRLSPPVQRRVAAGVLSAGHARALLAVTEPETQDKLAARVVAEGISVRGLEELVTVGSGQEDKPKRTRRTQPDAPGLTEIADRLGDRLDTRVKVQMGKKKGTLSIEFASLGDLERIVGVIDPRNRSDRPI